MNKIMAWFFYFAIIILGSFLNVFLASYLNIPKSPLNYSMGVGVGLLAGLFYGINIWSRKKDEDKEEIINSNNN